MKHFLLSIIVLWVTSSCTKVVEVDIPEHKAKAVVYSLFKQEDTIKVSLTKSKGIFDDNEYKIENANLYLLKNDVYIDTLQYKEDLYVSDVIAVCNQDYQLICKVPGMGVLRATAKIPDLPVITDTEITEVNISIDDYSYDIKYDRKLKFTLLDTPAKDSYYEIYLALQYYDNFNQQDVLEHLPGYNTNDPLIKNEDILQYYPETYVFSDKLFKDGSTDISIYYKSDTPSFYVNNLNSGDPYSFVIVARSISKDYYLFRKKLFAHTYLQDSDVWDGVGAPVQMYTNIAGGYGIFAGYSEIHKVFFTGIKE